ncbi:hypothetical protein H6G00_06450 [Leptolyngbya sp. FACHB-541]|uniref:hypothetical protein n=1 Tax=Leptolyngbya sp. FACHB-541 TaxID=2692810 RepID=UPI0016896493|nr:hypothetical protein [Leptolyngbya sp. FACHB-541]MBD1996258.1 hypothetical protein [Leptolyngbya sp. FACHB-541]
MKVPNQSHLERYFAGRKLYAGAIALALTALILPACTQPEATTEGPTGVTTNVSPEESVEVAEEANVQVGELTGNVEEYLGQTVSVRGEAENPIGEVAFVLQDDQLFGGEEVIVFNASGTPFLLPEGEITDEVQVTGEVRQLVIADFERDYGLDLDPDLYVDYEDRPAIVAQSIAFAPDPEEVSENPEAYYGQVIAVEGEVGEQLAPNTFTIQEEQLFGGENVLVVGVAPSPTLEEGENVVITGTLRPYVTADFERDYDLTWDLNVRNQIEAEYTQEPVLVADEVYPSAE